MNPTLQAQNAYNRNSVLSASPERLVLMLYDGALRFLGQAGLAMREGTVEQANGRLRRAEAIIDELNATLNPEAGEMAQQLGSIYLFCRRTLIEAQLAQDSVKVDAVARLLGELRGAWAEICP
ncbi:MAG TPA: flagellar export chaperone FliS [Thermoleophilaceae bacterium]